MQHISRQEAGLQPTGLGPIERKMPIDAVQGNSGGRNTLRRDNLTEKSRHFRPSQEAPGEPVQPQVQEQPDQQTQSLKSQPEQSQLSSETKEQPSQKNEGITKLGRDLPPPEGKYYTVAGVYVRTDSKIVISDAKDVLSQDARKKVESEFQRVGRPELYENFQLVAKSSEEIAHFVQHTRGELPGNETAQPAADDILNIEAYGVELNDQKRQLLNEVKDRVFYEMDYKGHPPQALILIDGEIQVQQDDPYWIEISEDPNGSVRYHKEIKYEADALAVQTKVLEWWFREKESLDFDANFS